LLSAIVLSAGKSRRMKGSLKALLPIGKTTFLEKIARDLELTGVDELFVILGARYDDILNRAFPSFRLIVIAFLYLLPMITSTMRFVWRKL